MGTLLGLKALHDGVEAVPDAVWHKIPYFCPPEEKEKQRRDSKQKEKQRSPRRSAQRTRSYSASYAEADAGQQRRNARNARPSSSSSSSSTAEQPDSRPAAQPPSAADAFPNTSASAVAFTDPFARHPAIAPPPIPGYSDGPAPPASSATPTAQRRSPSANTPHQASAYTPPYNLLPAQHQQLTYRGPRHSVTAAFAPMSTPGHNQPYFPPPPRGDDYPRSSYDPSRYQPAGDYAPRDSRTGFANDEQVGNYYGDDRGGRTASAGPRSRYDDDGYDDRRDDRSRHRRSKSRSSRHHKDDDSDEEGGERGVMGNVRSKFDTSESALGASALGAVVGGLIGHRFGKSPLATAAGVAVGGLGVNAWEAHRHQKKERYAEEPHRHHSSRRSGSADPIDSRTRRDLEYYGARADDDRASGVSRRDNARSAYDDDSAYDSGEDRRRRKRSSSRRRRDDSPDR